MTTYYTPISLGAAANAAVVNAPLEELDDQLVIEAAARIAGDAINAAAAAAAQTTANTVTSEVVAARNGYPNLDARIDDILFGYVGGNIATLTNGTAAAGQKNITVDSTVGFIVGGRVAYQLVSGALEYNVIAAITPTTVLTMTTNIGATGIGDDVYIGMMSVNEYLAAQAIPHAGSLTLPETVEYGNQNTFNVGAFTAAGATATLRIQAALDAAHSAGGGRVFIEPGVYDVSNVLFVYSNTTVTCIPGTVTLKGKAGAYSGSPTVDGTKIHATIGAIAASNVVIENLIIDHVTNSTEANGIVLASGGGAPNYTGTKCDNCIIRNNTVLGMPYNHQYMIWSFKSTNTNILYNTVDGGKTTYNIDDQQEGIEVAGGTNVLVLGNTCRNIGNNGIYLSCAALDSTERIGVRVIGNYTDTCINGIHLGIEAGATRSLEDCIVTNNVCRNSWENGIKVSFATGGVSRGFEISHNRIYNVALRGIWIQAATTGITAGGMVVDSNYIEHQTTEGNAAIMVKNMTGVRVTNNWARDAWHGYFINNCTDVDVVGNRAETCLANGIILGLLSEGDVNTRITIDNNVLLNYNMLVGSGTYEGILVAHTNYVTIRNNTLLCNSAKAETYGISVANTSSLAYLDGNRLEYASGFNPGIRCDAPDSNVGDFSVAASATHTLTNAMLLGGALLFLQQETGTPAYWTAVRWSNGVFLITFNGTTTGNFKYKISRDG